MPWMYGLGTMRMQACSGLRLRSTRLRLNAGETMAYALHMSRANLDIDDSACAEVMRRYGLRTKREAVNLALRTLASEPLALEEARNLRGSGWQGDLDDLRTSRLGTL